MEKSKYELLVYKSFVGTTKTMRVRMYFRQAPVLGIYPDSYLSVTTSFISVKRA